jgi:hypothetical protein
MMTKKKEATIGWLPTMHQAKHNKRSLLSRLSLSNPSLKLLHNPRDQHLNTRAPGPLLVQCPTKSASGMRRRVNGA